MRAQEWNRATGDALRWGWGSWPERHGWGGGSRRRTPAFQSGQSLRGGWACEYARSRAVARGGRNGVTQEQERRSAVESRSPFALRHRGIPGTGGRGPGRARPGGGERAGRGAQRCTPLCPPGRAGSPGRLPPALPTWALAGDPLPATAASAAGLETTGGGWWCGGHRAPEPGRRCAGARDASATRGPGGSERAPRPVVGGQSRAPLSWRVGLWYPRPGEGCSKRSRAPAAPTPPPAAPLPTCGDGAGRSQGRGT